MKFLYSHNSKKLGKITKKSLKNNKIFQLK